MKLDDHASSNRLMTRLDSSDVDSIDDVLVEHTRDCAVDVDLADCVWALCAIIHGVGLEC